jgi:hypothetical protein
VVATSVGSPARSHQLLLELVTYGRGQRHRPAGRGDCVTAAQRKLNWGKPSPHWVEVLPMAVSRGQGEPERRRRSMATSSASASSPFRVRQLPNRQAVVASHNVRDRAHCGRRSLVRFGRRHRFADQEQPNSAPARVPSHNLRSRWGLERSERGPFLTLVPPKLAVPVPPASVAVPLAPTRSSYATRRYFAWATYPLVVCHEPGEFINEIATRVDPAPQPGPDNAPRDLSELAREERSYKLSSLQGRRLPNPLWCSVKYRPWFAVLTETESCIDGDPNRWELVIGSPQVSLLWFGKLEDMPALPSLTVYTGTLALSSQSYTCCSGFKWCSTTNSCIPLQVSCQGESPA